MRVPDDFNKCVAFLGCATADGTPVFAGSALFFGDDTDEPPLTYLIAARHVIDRIRNKVAVILSGIVRHWPDFFIILLLQGRCQERRRP